MAGSGQPLAPATIQKTRTRRAIHGVRRRGAERCGIAAGVHDLAAGLSRALTGRRIMAMMFPDPFDALYQFQQAVEALHASDWLERSLSDGGAYAMR